MTLGIFIVFIHVKKYMVEMYKGSVFWRDRVTGDRVDCFYDDDFSLRIIEEFYGHMDYIGLICDDLCL